MKEEDITRGYFADRRHYEQIPGSGNAGDAEYYPVPIVDTAETRIIDGVLQEKTKNGWYPARVPEETRIIDGRWHKKTKKGWYPCPAPGEEGIPEANRVAHTPISVEKVGSGVVPKVVEHPAEQERTV